MRFFWNPSTFIETISLQWCNPWYTRFPLRNFNKTFLHQFRIYLVRNYAVKLSVNSFNAVSACGRQHKSSSSPSEAAALCPRGLCSGWSGIPVVSSLSDTAPCPANLLLFPRPLEVSLKSRRARTHGKSCRRAKLRKLLPSRCRTDGPGTERCHRLFLWRRATFRSYRCMWCWHLNWKIFQAQFWSQLIFQLLRLTLRLPTLDLAIRNRRDAELERNFSI